MAAWDRKFYEGVRRGQTQDKGVIGTLQKWKRHLASEGIVITQLQLIETILECCSSIVKLSVCQEKSEIQIFIMCHPLIFKKRLAINSYSSKTWRGPNKTCIWAEFNPWAFNLGSSGLVSEVNHTWMKSFIKNVAHMTKPWWVTQTVPARRVQRKEKEDWEDERKMDSRCYSLSCTRHVEGMWGNWRVCARNLGAPRRPPVPGWRGWALSSMSWGAIMYLLICCFRK